MILVFMLVVDLYLMTVSSSHNYYFKKQLQSSHCLKRVLNIKINQRKYPFQRINTIFIFPKSDLKLIKCNFYCFYLVLLNTLRQGGIITINIKEQFV